jgi:microcystin-dependent protein
MEGTIGEVRLFCGNFAPHGWMFCDGALLQVREYTALFSVIGRISETESEFFRLPNITPAADNMSYIICVNGTYPCRA